MKPLNTRVKALKKVVVFSKTGFCSHFYLTCYVTILPHLWRLCSNEYKLLTATISQELSQEEKDEKEMFFCRSYKFWVGQTETNETDEAHTDGPIVSTLFC